MPANEIQSGQPRRKTPKMAYVGLVLAVVVGFALAWGWRENRELALDSGGVVPTELRKTVISGIKAPGPSPTQPAAEGRSASHSPSVSAILEKLVTEPKGSPDSMLQELRTIKGELSRLTQTEATAILVGFLDSGTNAATGLPWRNEWKPGLRSWPSIRLFAMDMLGLINPDAAGKQAESVFMTMQSADEWALALRNSYLGNANSQYITQRLDQYLRHEPWVNNPSHGYLEGFDIAVVAAPGAAMLRLFSIHELATTNKATRFAALIATERIVENEPLAALRSLIGLNATTKHENTLRAMILAKANPLVSEVQDLLYDYISDRSLHVDELAIFLKRFPDLNRRISPNLLSTSKALPFGVMIATDKAAAEFLDRAALRVTNEYIRNQVLDARKNLLTKSKGMAQ